MKCTIPLMLVVVLLVVSCGKADPPQPQGVDTSTTPLPDRPAPDVPKDTVPEYPKPGQTNNHSSPDFKGGTADSK